MKYLLTVLGVVATCVSSLALGVCFADGKWLEAAVFHCAAVVSAGLTVVARGLLRGPRVEVEESDVVEEKGMTRYSKCLYFGPVEGKTGEIHKLVQAPCELFTFEAMAVPENCALVVVRVRINGQSVIEDLIKTIDAKSFPACKPDSQIELEVLFLEDGRWMAVMRGRVYR